MTDEIMYALMKLSGQEYVDEYAQRAKGKLSSALRHGRPAREDRVASVNGAAPRDGDTDKPADASSAAEATDGSNRGQEVPDASASGSGTIQD